MLIGCGIYENNYTEKWMGGSMIQEYNPYEHWVSCLECIYIEDCKIKEDRDGCLAGEKYEEVGQNNGCAS